MITVAKGQTIKYSGSPNNVMAGIFFRPARRDEKEARPGVPLPVSITDLTIKDQLDREERGKRKPKRIQPSIPSRTPLDEPPMGQKQKPTRGVDITERDEVRDDSGWERQDWI